MNIQTEKITPEVASVYLAQNTRNRPLNRKRAVAYAAAMQRGEFNGLNGDSIRFDSNGVLIDGQKRLTAIVMSGLPLETLVIRGLSPEAFKTIDNQETRSSGQRFAVQKEKNYNGLAASLSLLWKYKNGCFEGDLSRNATYQQLESLLAENDIRDDVHYVCGSEALKKLCPPSILGFCRFAFRQSSEDAGLAFFDAIEGVTPCSKNNPAFLLRDRMQDNRAAKAKLGSRDVLALWIKAFNAFSVPTELKFLRWSPGAGEAFPSVRGFLPSDVK